VTETVDELPDATRADGHISFEHAQEWWTQKDDYTLQGQFMLVMRILRKYGWIVAAPSDAQLVEEWGIRWRAGDLARVDPHRSEADARDFALIINPTGDARAEVVSRTVTRTDWQPVDTSKEISVR
jgi:hypothetical protein